MPAIADLSENRERGFMACACCFEFAAITVQDRDLAEGIGYRAGPGMTDCHYSMHA